MLVLVAAANTDEVSLACHSVLRAGPGLGGWGRGGSWRLLPSVVRMEGAQPSRGRSHPPTAVSSPSSRVHSAKLHPDLYIQLQLDAHL